MNPTPDETLFDSVFDLAEAQKRYFGFLSKDAWRAYANSGTILAAVDGPGDPEGDPSPEPRRLLGFAAYRLPRNQVTLAYLAVASSSRREGVARELINELSTRYAERAGIAVRCRRDYPANKVWPRLGFVARGDRPGRSLVGHHLTDWWLDHGHTDLLTWDGPTADITAVVSDANIFIDLHGDQEDAHARRTKMLLNDILAGRIQLLVTPELHNEIDRRKDSKARHRLQSIIGSYPRLAVSRSALESARQSLIDNLGYAPRSVRDESDLSHIAYAVAAGVPAFITRDNPALARLGAAASALGVRLLSPDELVVLVDETESAPSYMPAALLNTGYQINEAGVESRYDLLRFFDTGTGEKKVEFVRRLDHLAGNRTTTAHRLLYRDPDGTAIALLGMSCSEARGILDVSLARMRLNPLQTTLAFQIAAALRPAAERDGVSVIRVSDPHPHPVLYDALMASGFRPTASGPVALTIAGNTTCADLAGALASATERLSTSERHALEPLVTAASSITPSGELATFAMLEQQMSPVRILDANLLTWIIPIRPGFAAQLFGYPAELFPRTDELGISVEHVYYRKGPRGERAPGRVLWYVSGDRNAELMAISDLVEVIDDEPDALWRRFRRLGVYTRSQIHDKVDVNGLVRALRVANTVLLKHRIPLPRLRTLAVANGQRLSLQSPCRISPSLFASIMTEAEHGR